MTNTGKFSFYRKLLASSKKVDCVNELAKLLIRKRKIKQLFNFFYLIRI